MPVTAWSKVYDAADKASEQCREWAAAIKNVIDRLPKE
jgi:hypothetical protein